MKGLLLLAFVGGCTLPLPPIQVTQQLPVTRPTRPTLAQEMAEVKDGTKGLPIDLPVLSKGSIRRIILGFGTTSDEAVRAAQEKTDEQADEYILQAAQIRSFDYKGQILWACRYVIDLPPDPKDYQPAF